MYYLQSRYYNPEWGRFINADALVSTGQGILGNNMFAYCNNNPINLSDPAGCAPGEGLSFSKQLFFCCAMVVGAGCAAALQYAGGYAQKEEQTLAITTTFSPPQDEQYTVYFLSAKGDATNTIIYVGRVKTINFDTRMRYHSGMGRQLVSRIDNLSYAACRALEQAGMMYYHTINRGDRRMNQIRGVRPNNPNATFYFSVVYKLIASGAYNGDSILPVSYLLNQAENECLNGGM